MRNFKLFAQTLALLSGLLFFAGCQQEEIASPNLALGDRGDDTALSPNSTTSGFYGLGTSGEIYTFSLRPVYSISNTAIIAGMRPGEQIVAIDVRPLNGALYGVSNMSRIYLIDPVSGATKPLSQANFSPAIEGTMVGFDFNRSEDMLTLVTDQGQILTLHPYTGQVVGIGTASTLGIIGVTSQSGVLYAIDAEGSLHVLDQSGAAKPLGSSGLTIDGEGGFDTKNGLAFGVFLASGVVHNSSPNPDDLSLPEYRLYIFDLTTGEAYNQGIVAPMTGLAAQ